ncbi:MAG: hypothetical protein ACK5MU_03645 [Candidatus Saccharimonadales bacterium]
MTGSKKLIALLIAASCAIGANFFTSLSASAADFTITATDTAATKNQNIIFEEFNIGPGFASDTYPIVVKNQSSDPVKIELIAIAPDSGDANTLLPAIDIFFSNAAGGQNITDTHDKVVDMGFIAECIQPGAETNAFYTGFTFDKSYGNEYQDTSFKLIYTFSIMTDEQDCETETPNPPNPPDTGGLSILGSGDAVSSSLVIVIAVSSVSAIFFLFLILKNRKKSDDDNE